MDMFATGTLLVTTRTPHQGSMKSASARREQSRRLPGRAPPLARCRQHSPRESGANREEIESVTNGNEMLGEQLEAYTARRGGDASSAINTIGSEHVQTVGNNEESNASCRPRKIWLPQPASTGQGCTQTPQTPRSDLCCLQI